MDNEKRMIGNYEVKQAIHVGDKEVLFCEDLNSEHPYMCCYYTSNVILGNAFEGVGSDDYLEIMQMFCERVQGQIEQTRSQAVPGMGAITADMCHLDQRDKSIEGKVIAMRISALRGEYRSANNQLYLAAGGNGARGNARGNAVFCYNLYTGEHTRIERYQVLGEVKPEHMPTWAAERLACLQKEIAARKNDKGAR